jgi:hypothetical protein
MKLVFQHRTYEERDGEWVVHPAPASAPGFFRRAAQLTSTALVLAAIAIIGIAATVVGLLLLPIGALLAWLNND